MATLTPPSPAAERPLGETRERRVGRSSWWLAGVLFLAAVAVALVVWALVGTEESETVELMDRAFEVWADEDVAALPEVYAEDVVFVLGDGSTSEGLAALESLMPFAPTPQRVGEVIEMEPFAAAAYEYRTGDTTGLIVIEVEDGLVVRQQLFER